MSRKRKANQSLDDIAAIPEDIVAEGSGPVADVDQEARSLAESLADAAAVAFAGAEPSNPGDEPADATESISDPIVDESGVDPELEMAEADVVDAATLPTSASNMEPAELQNLVEALVFASDKPVTLQRLRQLTRVSDVRRLEQALADLREVHRDRGISLQSVSGGYQFRTNTRYSAWVQQLIAGRPVRLSRAQLETLSIIAYRQPITRPEIDDIRGVDSSGTLRVLIERSLIRILGKREEVGRPLLYGTTKEFLDFFSLTDLRELPTLREYSELTAESRRVMSDRLGVELDQGAAGVTGEPAIDDPADAPIDPSWSEPVSGDAVADAIDESIAATAAMGEVRGASAMDDSIARDDELDQPLADDEEGLSPAGLGESLADVGEPGDLTEEPQSE